MIIIFDKENDQKQVEENIKKYIDGIISNMSDNKTFDEVYERYMFSDAPNDMVNVLITAQMPLYVLNRLKAKYTHFESRKKRLLRAISESEKNITGVGHFELYEKDCDMEKHIPLIYGPFDGVALSNRIDKYYDDDLYLKNSNKKIRIIRAAV